MRSLASISFGIAFTIVLMLIAAFNRRKSSMVASTEPSPRPSPRKDASPVVTYDDALGTVESAEPSPRAGSVLTFRHRDKHAHIGSHGSTRH